MIVECVPHLGKLYFYSCDGEQPPNKFKYTTFEVIEKVTIYIVEINCNIPQTKSLNFESALANIKCNCGKVIKYKSINILPSYNWHEYIDLWSCHDSEFKSLSNIQCKPRKSGILAGPFYFMPDKDLFTCSCYKKIIFYNEIFMDFKIDDMIYVAFHNHFESNTYFYIHANIEIILFDKCYIGRLEDGEMFAALKIGYKTIKHREAESELMNSFFKRRITDIIKRNELGIKILDYHISFISMGTPTKIDI